MKKAHLFLASLCLAFSLGSCKEKKPDTQEMQDTYPNDTLDFEQGTSREIPDSSNLRDSIAPMVQDTL